MLTRPAPSRPRPRPWRQGDNWKTVSKVTKLSSVVSDPKISSSDAIGELDDFLVPSVSEHSTNDVINATAINDITTEEKELQKQAYYTV